jgi:hypothetical protein
MDFRDSWEPDYDFNPETIRLQLMIRELVRRLRLIEDQQETLSTLRSQQKTQAALCFEAGLDAFWRTCCYAQQLIVIGLNSVFSKRH